jgi:hypothetical protein
MLRIKEIYMYKLLLYFKSSLIKMFHMVKNDMFIFIYIYIYPCKLFCLFKNNFIRSNNIDDDD